MLQRFSKRVSIYTPVVFSSQRFIYISCIFLNYVFDNECIYIYIYLYLYIYTYIKKKVTRSLRLTFAVQTSQQTRTRRVMRGWTTSNVKKIKKFNKNVSVRDFLQLFTAF